MEQEEKLCNEGISLKEFTYLGGRLSADGGCETAVIVKTRC